MDTQTPDFSCIEVLRTLNCTRSNKEISNIFGISYSQINTWSSAVEDPDNANIVLHYFIYVLLEYFKRIDIDETKRLMEKHSLEANIDEIFLESVIFPENMLDSYISSSIAWKNNLISHLYSQNSDVMKAQLRLLEHFSECAYGKILGKEKISDEKVSELIFFNAPKHL